MSILDPVILTYTNSSYCWNCLLYGWSRYLGHVTHSIIVVLAFVAYLTFSHCLALKAPFKLLKKLDCPPFLNDSRICFDDDDNELLFVELEELELVVAVGTISRGKSAPHISHWFKLGWLMNVQIEHALLSVTVFVTGVFMLGDDTFACLRTPHNSHISDEALFEKKQIGQAHTLPFEVPVFKLCEDPFLDDDSVAAVVAATGSILMIIFGDDLKNPFYVIKS